METRLQFIKTDLFLSKNLLPLGIFTKNAFAECSSLHYFDKFVLYIALYFLLFLRNYKNESQRGLLTTNRWYALELAF